MKPNLLRRGFKSEAEKRSLDIRQQLGVTPKAACSARRVASLHNVSVSPAQCIVDLAKNHLSDLFPDHQIVSERMAWLLDSASEFSAVVAIVRGYKMILYNAEHSQARQESDIMHEMAHIICEHPGDCLQLNADIGLRYYNEHHEEEAKWLGATLQIPDNGLFALIKEGISNEAIAKIYGASLEMVIFRRNTLGIDIRLSRMRKKLSR